MPDPHSAALAALDSLGFALFEREATGTLRLSGPPPAWLSGLWPAIGTNGAELPVADASPVLENFLIDAEACWQAGGAERARSGPWIDKDPAGVEVPLEAIALTTDGRALLLLERLGEAFQVKQFVLQKARENVIAYQRLNAELLKKQILLHCVAEDMTASLANAITALRLVELEQDASKSRLLMGLASRALEEQQGLIHKVLDVFSEDLDGFYGRGPASSMADLRTAARAAVEELGPQFAEKGVPLALTDFDGGALPISVDAKHLQRIIANLLANALDATPPGRTATVRLEHGGDFALVRVEDGGPPVESQLPALLFTKLVPSSPHPEPAQLRLHFCRIAIENCGGDLGREPREGGGNSFWIRVPKARLAS